MSVSANVAVAAAVLLAGVGLLLFLVGLVTWWRLRHPRLLWVAVAFAFLCAQGVVLAQQAVRARGDVAESGLSGLVPTTALLGLAVAVALYLAAWKR